MFGIMSGKNKQDRIQRYTALETYLETSWASTSRSSRLLKRRFTQVQGEVLRAIAWWDWSHERLRETLPDIHALLEKHGT